MCHDCRLRKRGDERKRMENIAAMVDVMERHDGTHGLDVLSDTSTRLPDCLDCFEDWDFEVTMSPEVFQVSDVDEIDEFQSGSDRQPEAPLPLS